MDRRPVCVDVCITCRLAKWLMVVRGESTAPGGGENLGEPHRHVPCPSSNDANRECVFGPRAMLHYPKIPGSRNCPSGPCIAFEKYDGTNLHWDWDRDFSFHAFGTRRD